MFHLAAAVAESPPPMIPTPPFGANTCNSVICTLFISIKILHVYDRLYMVQCSPPPSPFLHLHSAYWTIHLQYLFIYNSHATLLNIDCCSLQNYKILQPKANLAAFDSAQKAQTHKGALGRLNERGEHSVSYCRSRIEIVLSKLAWGMKICNRFQQRLPPSQQSLVILRKAGHIASYWNAKWISKFILNISEQFASLNNQVFEASQNYKRGRLGITCIVHKCLCSLREIVEFKNASRPIPDDLRLTAQSLSADSKSKRRTSSLIVLESHGSTFDSTPMTRSENPAVLAAFTLLAKSSIPRLVISTVNV